MASYASCCITAIASNKEINRSGRMPLPTCIGQLSVALFKWNNGSFSISRRSRILTTSYINTPAPDERQEHIMRVTSSFRTKVGHVAGVTRLRSCWTLFTASSPVFAVKLITLLSQPFTKDSTRRHLVACTVVRDAVVRSLIPSFIVRFSCLQFVISARFASGCVTERVSNMVWEVSSSLRSLLPQRYE